MADILQQINTIKTTTKDEELREAIVSALEALASVDQTDAINSLKKTLMGLSDKLNSKADISDVSTIKLTSDEINKINELKDAINEITKQMPLKVSTGQFRRLQTEVESKADRASVEKELGLKATKESVNKVTNALETKADSSEMARALSLKADSKTVAELSKALESKADSKDVSGLEFKMENSVATKSLKAMPTEEALAPMVRAAVEQYATEELVNLLRSYTNEQLNLKASQHDFDHIVGTGFQGWTITDYIIRIREDYNTALAEMMTKAEGNALAEDVIASAGNIVQIGGTLEEDAKLYVDNETLESSDEISLATMGDVDEAVGRLSKYFTFTLKSTFEIGGLDEHGWNAENAKEARSVSYLNARDFTLSLTSPYKLKVISYDEYKLILGQSPWLTGSIAYDVDSIDGTKYIKLLVERVNGADISSGDISVLSNMWITMFGTDFTGTSSEAAASIDYVDKKISKNQGAANAGKVLTVGNDGTVILAATGLSAELKQALIDAFADVAWSTDQGPAHCAAILNALQVSDTLSTAPIVRSIKREMPVKEVKEEQVQEESNEIIEETVLEKVEENVEEKVYSLKNNDFILIGKTLGDGFALTETLAENTRMSIVDASGKNKYINEEYYAIDVPEEMNSLYVYVTPEDSEVSIASFDDNGNVLKQTDYVTGRGYLGLLGASCVWVGLKKSSGYAYEDGDINDIVLEFKKEAMN